MVSEEVRCPISEYQDKLPLMPHWPRNPFGMDYGINKRLCEDVLWEAHEDGVLDVSMLRPTFVCGPEDPGIRDWFWIQRILDGGPLLVPGSGDHAFQVVYIDDLARAVADLVEAGESSGRAYNVAGEDILTLNEYLRRLGALLQRDVEIVNVDQDVFDRLPFSTHPRGDVFPFNTRRTAVFKLDRIKHDLGYRCTSFEDWIVPTIDWYRNTYGADSLGYERRRDETQFAETWKTEQTEVRSRAVPVTAR